MGASDWHYIIPYQPDINKALQELRQLVFEQRAYYKPAQFLKHTLDILPEDTQHEIQKLIDELESAPTPATIEELIEMNREEGTHSIIDIEAISSTPDFGVAWPLSREQLLDVFGTEQPTREMVAEKEKAGVLADFRSRWEGLYIIVYKDGQPSEIFFRGYSGD